MPKIQEIVERVKDIRGREGAVGVFAIGEPIEFGFCGAVQEVVGEFGGYTLFSPSYPTHPEVGFPPGHKVGIIPIDGTTGVIIQATKDQPFDVVIGQVGDASDLTQVIGTLGEITGYHDWSLF